MASALVCDECCDALMEGDPRRLGPLVAGSGGSIDIREAAALCLACHRLPARAVRSVSDTEATPRC